ncbi:HAMP domain-containing sensor histidine kinase [Ferrimonas sp. SCSIO 43195]|uniref:sensor histidine kinase n=1 Tax=Ferrimonas sp. SCSIO 43195 TaxID=2822844 RepID=UPI0020751FB6|nr:HAMP domain-containing sensor histidine kinase [Ferrimonas sp. SCSIO 43195]USD36157.1 HAMP domain-containing histidine kinase [Ferrimonas sp. SCSIO 43195]
MIRHRLSNVRTMTSRLMAAFFVMSIGISFTMMTLFNTALHWGEDAVNERSLQISKDVAIARYLTGASGPLEIDRITFAYDNTDDVPDFIPDRLRFAGHALEELIDDDLGSIYVLTTEFVKHGHTQPLILIAKTEQVEVTDRETVLLNLLIIAATIGIMLVAGVIVYLLSVRLIQPVKELGDQLAALNNDTRTPLSVPESSAEEFVQLTDAFNAYRHQLDLLIRREQAFARYASHELRTPLTIVRGAANLLNHSDKPEFIGRQQKRILTATEEMQTMVDALLSMVRYEKNEHHLEPRHLEENELRAIIEHEQTGADNKHVGLQLSLTQAPLIKAEPAVVRMIIGNLLRNAIAATESGEVKVCVDAEALEVRDQGPGLNQTHCGGHGLGLLIVEDLCQRYHWRFSLTDIDGGGCCARIEF